MLDIFRVICDTLFIGWGDGRPTKTKRMTAMSTSIYSPDRVAALTAAQPLNWQKCQQFAADWGTTPRSVQSKSASLGLEYAKLQPKPKSASADQPTKADYLRDIRAALALPEREGDLTKAELAAIVVAIA